jgi:hypothetical protein
MSRGDDPSHKDRDDPTPDAPRGICRSGATAPDVYALSRASQQLMHDYRDRFAGVA